MEVTNCDPTEEQINESKKEYLSQMTPYKEGDVVLVGATLGIVTASNKVKEVKGDGILCNHLNDKRILKKLSAGDLARCLVDLMNRYSILKKRKQSASLSVSQPIDHNNPNNALQQQGCKRSQQHNRYHTLNQLSKLPPIATKSTEYTDDDDEMIDDQRMEEILRTCM